MNLLTLYSRVTGLEAKDQHLNEHFFPLPENPYIVLHASSGMGSKNYSYWSEVVQILHPILKANNVSLIQIGGPEDPPVIHCNHLQGKTSLHQSGYIIRNALMLMGNDSFSGHRAGHINVPILTLFGATDPANHFAAQHPANSIALVSHRGGNNPSFQSQEHEKTIDLIPPEQVINSVLQILGSNLAFQRESFYIGRAYNSSIIEWVPDAPLHPQFLPDAPITCRADYLEQFTEQNEQILAQTLNSGRKLVICSSHPIHLGLINQFRDKINAIIFEVNEKFSLEYVKSLKKIPIKVKFVSYEEDKGKLSDMRLQFFDYAVIEKQTRRSKEDFLTAKSKYQNKELDKDWTIPDNGWYKSNRFILSQNQIYLSKFALKNGFPLQDFSHNIQTLIDDKLIWEEMDFFYFFSQQIQENK